MMKPDKKKRLLQKNATDYVTSDTPVFVTLQKQSMKSAQMPSTNSDFKTSHNL